MFVAVSAVVALSFFGVPAQGEQVADDFQQEVAQPTIIQKEVEITDNAMAVSYEIVNRSAKDIWILAGGGKFDVSANAFFDEDTRTIVLTNRFDFPGITFGRNALYPRYTRLPSGHAQAEAISFPLPVQVTSNGTAPGKEQTPWYANRLVIEISYCAGDLPGAVRALLLEAEETKSGHNQPDAGVVSSGFGGLVGFTRMNEGLRSRGEETVILYSKEALRGERTLRIAVDGLHVACLQEAMATWPSPPAPPDLTSCKRVEIRYEPSMLAFLFPYDNQRALMTHAEIQDLALQTNIVVADTGTLKSLVRDIGETVCTTGVVRQRTVAHLTCYGHEDNEHPTLFCISNNDSVLTEEGNRFTNLGGFESLTSLTTQTRALDIRVRCGANLQDLWHRLRSFRHFRKSWFRRSTTFCEVVYPRPTEWDDTIVRVYGYSEMALRPFKCPGAEGDKCHYAMNPNCKSDSPADMVLLFETKASWNQHGGPELFTFDNHDPRGGLVLLNDGTVKFIRTEEELKQLRWGKSGVTSGGRN
jgi:hypothetical protein